MRWKVRNDGHWYPSALRCSTNRTLSKPRSTCYQFIQRILPWLSEKISH
jgi:hypothetical protein